MSSLARIKSYVKSNDYFKHKISVLVFKSFESAIKCYDPIDGKIKLNNLSTMLYDTYEAEHLNLDNGKIVLVINKINLDTKNNLVFFEVLCDGKTFWINELNLDII